MDIVYQGNESILKEDLTAFLCSRSTSSRAILPSLDWAVEQKNTNRAVVSTFHSPIEQSVLKILLLGKQPIVVVVARKPYSKLPEEYIKPLEDGRLLLIYTSNQSRIDRKSSLLANRYACTLARRAVFGYIGQGSSAQEIWEELEIEKMRLVE